MAKADREAIAQQLERMAADVSNLKDEMMQVLAQEDEHPASKADLEALEWQLRTLVLTTVLAAAALTVASICLILLI